MRLSVAHRAHRTCKVPTRRSEPPAEHHPNEFIRVNLLHVPPTKSTPAAALLVHLASHVIDLPLALVAQHLAQ